MNESQLFLNESECAKAAGVSLDTIRQFTETGLLSPQKRENEWVYSSEQLSTVFQVKTLHIDEPSSQKSSSKTTNPLKEPTQQNPIPEPVVPSIPAEQKHTVQTTEEPTTNPNNPESSDKEQALLNTNQMLQEQIQLLREERDWLRKRLEVLESRAERDQMLLMSNTATIQRLTTEQQKTTSKKLFRFSLPWLLPPVEEPKKNR